MTPLKRAMNDKGIRGLMMQGNLRLGEAPKTLKSTLDQKKAAYAGHVNKEMWIKDKIQQNKQAIERFKEKFGKKEPTTVEDFRDKGDWDPYGMNQGGIARLGYAFGGKALKAIMDAWRANKTWGVGGPPYNVDATSFDVKKMTKKHLGTELSLNELRKLSDSPLSDKKVTFDQFNQQFKNIKASVLKEKMMEQKLEAKAMIHSADMVPANTEIEKRVQAQFSREGKQKLAEAKEGLKAIDIYQGMLQKKGRSVHYAGGLAPLVGEPSYAADFYDDRTPMKKGRKVKKKKTEREVIKEMIKKLPRHLWRMRPSGKQRYKKKSDLPEGILEILEKDPGFNFEDFAKIYWSPEGAQWTDEGFSRGRLGSYSGMTGDIELGMAPFGKKAYKEWELGKPHLDIKALSDEDKAVVALHELRHKNILENRELFETQPDWVKSIEGPGYLPEGGTTGHELYTRFLDKRFNPTISDPGRHDPYFDKILRDYWEPYAQEYEKTAGRLKSEKRGEGIETYAADGGRITFSGGGKAGLPAITYGMSHPEMQGPQMPAGPQPAGMSGAQLQTDQNLLMQQQMMQNPWMQNNMKQGIGGTPQYKGQLRMPFSGGGMGRRAFLKLMASLGALPFVGKGVQKAAPKAMKAAETITRNADGIPAYAFDLIEVVKAKGTKEIMEGIYKRSPPSTKYNYKGVDVVEDGMGNTSVSKNMEETKSWNDAANDDVIIEDVVDREIGFEIRKGEDIVKDEGLETQKAIRGSDEYNESTAYMQGDPEGGLDVSDVTEIIEEGDHLELKTIADEIVDIRPKKASGGLAYALGE